MADVDIDREALRKEIDAALHGKKKEPQPPAGFELNQHSSVKHVIGVVSGKGGVGKSFVTGILATNLARAGKRVGILDGDITGPSIPRMFGISDERSYGVEEQLIPIEDANGIKIMSANLVLQNETDPVLWRGPVVAGAIQQFYSQCNWGDLDYLLIDMPPGTGDVALTVFQSLPVEGVVIVSSPQDLVQMVVGKAVRMAEMMHVPVLGLIENMAYISCPHCDERIEPYGPSKLAETAAAFNLKPLGQLPMDATFAQIADKGTFSTELPEGLVPDATQSVLDL
ncbi:MAG: Mrp/NBP35 family ATP-binding protein [Atopobium sp.]|nr:Mrp/NBP35 family ATP-binding protein [Atopobium sp.]